jgi:hypothetical protein
VYLRLIEAADLIAVRASEVNSTLDDKHPLHSVGRKIQIIHTPAEFSEAWQNIDLFPRDLVRQIAIVMAKLRIVDKLLDHYKNSVDVTQEKFRSDHRTEYLELCKRLANESYRLELALTDYIEHIEVD